MWFARACRLRVAGLAAFALVCSVLALHASATAAQSPQAPMLFRQPALSRTHICFSSAGDLWIVPREGGDARRLTTGVDVEEQPCFSPDGSTIAFVGRYDGNADVYTVPASGGVPRRITYHPGGDAPVAWSADGKRILMRSGRLSYSRFLRLFWVRADGMGLPEPLPLPEAFEGSLSPDGNYIAYCPLSPAFRAWKRYRGGTASYIQIARLADSTVERLPRTDSNDFRPMWIGHRIFFLSDRRGAMSLHFYDTRTKAVRQAFRNDGLDLKWASAGPDAIVYERFGEIGLYDLQTGAATPVPIRLSGDLPQVRRRVVTTAGNISSASISPSGARAVFEARGDIYTAPAEKGDVRNLTQTSGVAERSPTWSPDGRLVSYLSDESGEYALHLADPLGKQPVRKIALGQEPSFFTSTVWSPDSKRIALLDVRLKLWLLDVEKGEMKLVDTAPIDGGDWRVRWSADSKWLTYARPLRNRLRAVFLHNIESGAISQVTDGMSDAAMPGFDRSGKYLFFAASTDVGLNVGMEMSAFGRRVTRSVYAAVLRKDLPSPVQPESDEERPSQPAPAAPDAATKAQPAAPDAAKVPGIDIEAIDQRIVSLPIPARNYVGLETGREGTVFLLEGPAPGSQGVSLHRFELRTRRTEQVLPNVTAFALTPSGERMLYATGGRWHIAGATGPVAPGSGALNLDGMETNLDPAAEWRQMFRESYRLQRDFFYAPNFHGLDLAASEKRYTPYLDGLASRQDLNYLLEEVFGDLTVGHLYVSGGDVPRSASVAGGLLGCDYTIAHGRYRFDRVYNGESWNPQLRAPLTQPGVNVRAGEYLLAVDGKDLRDTDNVYAALEGTAGRQVTLKVGPNPDGTGSREVTVVPVADESALRQLAWIEGNRRKVAEMSGGRLAYVYLPDTSMGGYTAFNRYYFSQTDRDGAVIDGRYNGGGSLPDYIVDYLRRPLLNGWAVRHGADYFSPGAAIFGPKAMLINEYAGSGGDLLPWYFRRYGIGPLIGKRTWGGLVGIGGTPRLIDGGAITTPSFAFYNLEGKWDVENHGVDPDIEVDRDPALWRTGRDPQIERAVEVLMAELRRNPPTRGKRPAYPDYHQR
ncbi:MAG TPA: PDZ domain-containing protein [Chthonomonadales bacterium]|nr:PDZ domain-containing protein [Chthonomonadales bacterium]